MANFQFGFGSTLSNMEEIGVMSDSKKLEYNIRKYHHTVHEMI